MPMPTGSLIQIAVCIVLTVLVGLATWLTIRRSAHDGSRKDVYLAGGKLSLVVRWQGQSR